MLDLTADAAAFAFGCSLDEGVQFRRQVDGNLLHGVTLYFSGAAPLLKVLHLATHHRMDCLLQLQLSCHAPRGVAFRLQGRACHRRCYRPRRAGRGIRRRKGALQLSDTVVDALAGLTDGHIQKLLGVVPVRTLGSITLSALLGALGVKLVCRGRCRAGRTHRPAVTGRSGRCGFATTPLQKTENNRTAGHGSATFAPQFDSTCGYRLFRGRT
jgi:hypothetical protein